MKKVKLIACLEDGVTHGHLEKDAQGRFRITTAGTEILAKHLIFDFFSSHHDSAFTFGALVTMFEFSPEVIVSALATFLHDGAIHHGFLSKDEAVCYFHLCPHQKHLKLYGGNDERPGQSKYEKYSRQTLLAASSIGRRP